MSSILTLADYGAWLPTWSVFALLLIGLTGFSYGTRAGIIARATTKEAIRQPLFILSLMICLVVILLNTFTPFFTFGEDLKQLKDCGLTVLLISGLLLAVWTAGSTITSEIEGKTAMTLLSKPINRRQFVLGKYVGIVQAVLWLYLFLSVFLMGCIYYKVGYDQRETAKEVTPVLKWEEVSDGVELPMPHPERLSEVSQTLPGVVLAFLEVTILAAVSVAIATRLPMVVNLVACFSIYVIGHLTPVLLQQSSKEGGSEFVAFTAGLIATILPNLDGYNVSAAITTGATVPQTYLGVALIYSAAYIGAIILFAFLLFEDRDLA